MVMEERKMRKMKMEERFYLRELKRIWVFVRENENEVKNVCVLVAMRCTWFEGVHFKILD